MTGSDQEVKYLVTKVVHLNLGDIFLERKLHFLEQLLMTYLTISKYPAKIFQNLPLELIGQTIKAVPLKKFITMYNEARKKTSKKK